MDPTIQNQEERSVEQIVADNRVLRSALFRILSVWGGIFLASVFYLLCTLYASLWLGIGLVLVILVLTFTVYKKVKRATSVEYSYSFVNGHMVVTKICCKNDYEFLLEFSCEDVVMMGRCSVNHLKLLDATAGHVIRAIPSPDIPNIWFIVVNWQDIQKRLLFVPNEEMVDAFRKYLPKDKFSEI